MSKYISIIVPVNKQKLDTPRLGFHSLTGLLHTALIFFFFFKSKIQRNIEKEAPLLMKEVRRYNNGI